MLVLLCSDIVETWLQDFAPNALRRASIVIMFFECLGLARRVYQRLLNMFPINLSHRKGIFSAHQRILVLILKT